MWPQPQRLIVDDLVLRQVRVLHAGRTEEAHDCPTRLEHLDQVPGNALSGRLVEKVEVIPAENAVDTPLLLPQPRLDGVGERVHRSRFAVTLEFGEEVFDEQLAAQSLA